MTISISIAKALQMAGYITTSGHCNKLKCYAVYASPKKPYDSSIHWKTSFRWLLYALQCQRQACLHAETKGVRQNDFAAY